MLLVVEDVRRLLMQNIVVDQSKTKMMDNMWAKVCEADRSNTEQLLRCQQLELEVWRTKADLATCRASLQAGQSDRQSLERSITDRDEMITELRNQLSICQDANQDLTGCTAKLTEAVWDLAGADDEEAEAERVRFRYDERELHCARLKRRVASIESEKSQLQEEIRQWVERYGQLCAESNGKIVLRDQTIYSLRSFLQENGLCSPA